MRAKMKRKAALVVGGGIAGMQAAIDLANMGIQVHLVEKKPSIGGRMAQLDKTFRLLIISRNKNLFSFFDRDIGGNYNYK